jgi:hypothetical protein
LERAFAMTGRLVEFAMDAGIQRKKGQKRRGITEWQNLE